MKGYICTVLFILLALQLLSQLEIDSSAIMFKAKLLTTSRFGIAEPTIIIDEIKKQNAIFLSSPSENILFIKINFKQKFHEQAELFGECSYFIAFNQSTMTFYRLGGFDEVDLDSFFKDLEPIDYKLYNIGLTEDSEIDFACLAEYSELSSKKQKKRKYECFPKCSDILFKKLIIPSAPE